MCGDVVALEASADSIKHSHVLKQTEERSWKGKKGKVKRYLFGLFRPRGLQKVEAPRFKDRIRNWQGFQPYAPAAFIPPGNIVDTNFCKTLSRPHSRSAAGRTTSMKIFEIIRNWTRVLKACSAVPQPNVPQLVTFFVCVSMHMYVYMYMCVSMYVCMYECNNSRTAE